MPGLFVETLQVVVVRNALGTGSFSPECSARNRIDESGRHETESLVAPYPHRHCDSGCNCVGYRLSSACQKVEFGAVRWCFTICVAQLPCGSSDVDCAPSRGEDLSALFPFADGSHKEPDDGPDFDV